MRVQLITHSYLPENTPPRRRWETFIAQLIAAGHEVDVIAPVGDPRWLSDDIDAAAADMRWGPSGERIIRVPRLSRLTGSRDGRFLASVVQSLTAIPVALGVERPEVLIVTLPALPLVVPAWLLAKVRGSALVVEMRDAWPDLAFDSGVKAGALSTLLAHLVTGIQLQADTVVTVTRGFGALLRERGIDPVVHIGNGLRRPHSWPDSSPRVRTSGELNVLYLGNHGESQGLETIVEAAALAQRAVPGIRVRFVGDGTQVQRLHEMNTSCGSPVEMLASVPASSVGEHYAWADTCIVTLRPDWQSFGWTIPSKSYELISTGKHLTGIVTGEAAEILKDYGNAQVMAADAEVIAEAWIRMAKDATSTPWSPIGAEWVDQHASLPRLGEQMAAVIDETQKQKVRKLGPSESKSSQLRDNASLVATTVGDHLTDDPILLALQVSRRLPQRVRGPLSALGSKVHGGKLDLVRGVSLAASGRSSELRQMALNAVDKRASGRSLAAWADVLINDGQPDTAEWILDRIRPGTPGLAPARARLAWYRGQMSNAVRHLDSVKSRRQHDRLASELRSYLGQRPSLTKVENFSPLSGQVLHVLTNSLPQTGSGYAQRSHSILRSLRDRGWNVSAVTRLGWPVQTGSLTAAHEDVVDGIVYHRLLPRRLENGFDARLQQQAELLLDLVQKTRPSLLHTTTHWTNAVIVQAVAEAVGIPWVYEVRGQLADTWASSRGKEALSSERYRLFVEREDEVSRQANAVVTLGTGMRTRLIDAGVDAKRIQMCPNAIGGEFLEEPGKQLDARVRLGLDPALEYIGTVSSIVAYEGLDTVVEAVAHLAATRPKLRFLVVGDGADLPRLKERATELGISDRLITPGRVDRSLAHLYHQSLDVFVVPRKDTSVTRAVTPMKPLEASASGRPVVASDLPALAELVQDGITGRLVAPERPAEWASVIDRLLENPETARDMGEAGRAWVLTERTWSANAEKYDRIYQELIRERS
ncbi:MAG: glycosyltransferase family 4 protein [Micrococcaceae bacterium]